MALTSVNFHFWPLCNFQCKYCFAQFKNFAKILSKNECIRIIKELANNGDQKLNFVGGEPTLCPYLGELILYSKKLGLITTIVSNGTGIVQKFIDKYKNAIDWIGLSLDSGKEEINKILGRGNGHVVRNTIEKCKMIKRARIHLKINSVVTRLNFSEDMSNVIKLLEPERWKVFQVLEIEGQNSKSIKELLISRNEFKQFVKKHEYLNPIVENNQDMIESYVMIDPSGRFYQNSNFIYNFSRPILNVGIQNALNDIIYNHLKFVKRGGLYA